MEFQPKDCFARKIMKASRLIGQIYRRHLSPFGITNSQMSILFMIYQRKELTQTQLSEMLAMEKSTVSRNLIRLFDKGFIEKKASRITMLDKGIDLVHNILPHWELAMKEVNAMIGRQGADAINLVLSRLVA